MTSIASPGGAAPIPPTGKPAIAIPKSPPDFTIITQMIDKMFPPQPDPDPARLSIGRAAVLAMWPDGSFNRMFIGLYGGMFDRLMQMKKSDLIPSKIVPAKDGSAPDISLHDQAAAKDPYFDQRMVAVRAVITDEMARISPIVDPKVREGLARAMARRLDAKQLADINLFFTTPSGHAFAGQYMQLWADPDMMHAMMSTLPEMIRLMPDAMAKIKAANERFPKPPADKSKPNKS